MEPIDRLTRVSTLRTGECMDESEMVLVKGTPQVDGFTQFYARCRDPLRRALALATGDVAMADEAIDEALTRAVSSWDTLSTYEHPEGWVYRVGLNWARGRYRKRRYEFLSSINHERPGELEAPDLDVIAAIAALSTRSRQVVIARYYLDWSTTEVAEALGIPEGTVKSRLARALDRIGREIGELR